MIPSIYNLPLKIVHAFPYSADAALNEKKAAVTEYLVDISKRGFGGVVTNVSFHNYMFDDEEWTVFAFVAEECERLGLRLWIYDENGYPSGSAGGLTLAKNPDFEARGLVMIKRAIAPGEELVEELPKGHRHFLFAGVYRADENGGVIPDDKGEYNPIFAADCRYGRDRVLLRNTADVAAVAVWFLEKNLYEGTHCVHNVWESRRYIDVTSREAVGAFLRNTYDKYFACVPERFSEGAAKARVLPGRIEAIFTDEPSLMGCYINAGLYPKNVHDEYDSTIPLYPVLSYGCDVAGQYGARFERELFSDLTAIFLGDTERANEIREDYYSLLSDLYEKNYFGQLSEWCEKHKVSLSGHLLLEDNIRYHTVFEGNYFSLLRHMHYPGIDILHSIPEYFAGGAFAFTPKLVSSIAHHYNRPHVMSEASAYAQGGNVTHEQAYASLCAQMALGVDIFTFYYEEDFMDHETYTRHNRALGRIGQIMEGKHRADVLLYYPIETFRRHHRPSDAQYGAYTDTENAAKDGLWKIMNALFASQIDFDFVDGEALSAMTLDEQGLLVGKNGEKYGALLLPPMDITEKMASTLDALFGKTKIISFDDIAGVGDDEIVRRVNTALDEYCGFRAARVFGEAKGILRLTRDTEGGTATLLVNTGSEKKTVSLAVYGFSDPVVYDPMSDALRSADITVAENGFVIRVEICARESLIITQRQKIN